MVKFHLQCINATTNFIHPADKLFPRPSRTPERHRISCPHPSMSVVCISLWLFPENHELWRSTNHLRILPCWWFLFGNGPKFLKYPPQLLIYDPQYPKNNFLLQPAYAHKIPASLCPDVAGGGVVSCGAALIMVIWLFGFVFCNTDICVCICNTEIAGV